MARPQNFDTKEVLTKASILFWKLGYNSTSINDLEKAMGISRISIYNKFGSKEGLFLTIADNYIDMSIPVIKDILSQKSFDGLVELFQMVSSPRPSLPSKILSYLIVNTTLSSHNTTPAINQKLTDFKNQIKSEIKETLVRANQRDTEAKADLLVSLLWGMIATSHINQSQKEQERTSQQVNILINSWKN